MVKLDAACWVSCPTAAMLPVAVRTADPGSTSAATAAMLLLAVRLAAPT